ncbi:type IV toxin-antitoxin system AbiEi family antitoxin domain-containing protein [Rosistilla ulvae]|nr:type IV toxin-antitoxin system AbiEi family antitoxin domain-containing protein [Rosistilla ulvae]
MTHTKPSSRLSSTLRATEIFRAHGGMMRMADAVRVGISRRTLYQMRDSGQLEQLARGLYRIADLPPLSEPDLVTVAQKVPQGVVYLISALAFHGLTTQIPHEVWIAIPRNSEPPRLAFPPTRAARLSDIAYQLGIEMQNCDGVTVKVYSREKTLVDCFCRRNEIGLDVAIEAVKAYRTQKRTNFDLVMDYAKKLRAAKTMRPYLEALL